MRYCLLIFVLALVTALFAMPQLIRSGPNVVAKSYQVGTARLLDGQSPYVPPPHGADWYKYSPAFAYLYLPFLKLPPSYAVIFWAILNAFVFWFGALLWLSGSLPRKFLHWFAVIACGLELNGPLIYQQINPLIAGLMFAGLYFATQAEVRRSSWCLSLGTNLKVLPGVFLGVLLLRMPRRFRAEALGVLLFLFLLPVIHLGFKGNLVVHWEWIQLLLSDASSAGIMDIASALERLGFSGAGKILSVSIFVVSIFLLLWTTRQGRTPDWCSWVSVGVCALLLTSPRTESPTLVLVAPCYLLLADVVLGFRGRTSRWLGIGVFVLSVFLISIVTNDIWPRALLDPERIGSDTRIFGVFGLWVIAFLGCLQGSFLRLGSGKLKL